MTLRYFELKIQSRLAFFKNMSGKFAAVGGGFQRKGTYLGVSPSPALYGAQAWPWVPGALETGGQAPPLRARLGQQAKQPRKSYRPERKPKSWGLPGLVSQGHRCTGFPRFHLSPQSPS